MTAPDPSTPPPALHWRGLVETLALAALGGGAGHLAGVPAGILSGSALVVAIAAVAGRTMVLPDRLRDIVFVLLGLTMGAGVTPQTLGKIGEWPESMAILVVTIVAIIAGVVAFLRFVCGWDRSTAFFAAVPGALSYVMMAAFAAGADTRRVAIVQSVRLLILIVALPSFVVIGTGHSVAPPPPPASELWEIPVLLVAGAAGALLAAAVRLPGGLMFGGFLVSATMHATGFITGTLPFAVVAVCFVLLGAFIGQRFNGVTLRELASAVLAGLGAFAVAIVIAVIGAVAVSLVTVIPLGSALVAFAPGALEGMTALAFGLGLDPAYVAAHQLFRFLLIALTIPFIARVYTNRSLPK